MRVRFLGHACFHFERSDGLTVLLDPYRPGALGGRIAHAPIQDTPAIVAVSHYHEDHGWIGGVQGRPSIVDRSQTVALEPGDAVRFDCVATHHDGDAGCRMGLNRMIAFTLDGCRVLHPGDLGTLPSAAQLAAIGDVDLLLLPVGGRFTLEVPDAVTLMEQLAPKWVIPMHYRSARVDLPMGTRGEFLDHLGSTYPVLANWAGPQDPRAQRGTTLVPMDPER